MKRAALAKALRSLGRHWPDAVIIALLVLLSLWVRRLTLLDIEAGGDAVRKWFFVKQWGHIELGELAWDHHMSRFGINIWAFLAQKLWGTGAAVYYVAPVAAATAAVVFSYKLGQELGGRFAGALAALWLITLEPMERSGSQLLPGVFCAAYIAAAAYFLLWYLRFSGNARWRSVLLIVSALFLFFAYLSKESNLLFVPGFFLALWFLGGNRRDFLIFAGIFVGGVLLETAWYLVFTDYSTRVEIVNSSHRGGTVRDVSKYVRVEPGDGGGGGVSGRVRSEKVLDYAAVFWKFLERYQVLWESIKFPLYLFLGASLGLAVFAKQRPARAIALIVFTFLLLTTFSIRKLDPLKVWMSNEPRYFVVLCPLLLCVNAAFLAELVRRAQRAFRNRARTGLGPRLRAMLESRLPVTTRLAALGSAVWQKARPAFAPAWVALFCWLIGAHYYDRDAQRLLKRDYPINVVQNHQKRFSDAYARGLPIVEKRSKHKKALRLIWSVYLDETLLERDGKLPSFEAGVQRLDNGHDWLSKSPSEYAPDALDKLRRSRKCAYVTRIHGRYLRVQPSGKLPASCRAETRNVD